MYFTYTTNIVLHDLFPILDGWLSDSIGNILDFRLIDNADWLIIPCDISVDIGSKQTDFRPYSAVVRPLERMATFGAPVILANTVVDFFFVLPKSFDFSTHAFVGGPEFVFDGDLFVKAVKDDAKVMAEHMLYKMVISTVELDDDAE